MTTGSKYSIGDKFNLLTLIARMPGTIYSIFRCECGTECRKVYHNVFSGRIKSCGCYQARAYGKHVIVHGMTGTPEHQCWVNMKNRCNNPGLPNYLDYGGRGITYCPEWESFGAFFKDMGYRPSRRHSIGGIDNDGDYEPSNCAWQTKREQQVNRRITRKLCTGEPVDEFCKRLSISLSNFYGLKTYHGMSLDEASDYYMAKRGMLA